MGVNGASNEAQEASRAKSKKKNGTYSPMKDKRINNKFAGKNSQG
jgi:hypothetical protein